MLSDIWHEECGNAELRSNLFRGLAQIQLAMARPKLPVIGSFTIGDSGSLSLRNRPLLLEMQDLENQHVPVEIPRDYTYSTVTSFVSDVLRYHDSRLRHQPNAVSSLADAFYQQSILTFMRVVAHQLPYRDLERGPFGFMLTDLHQSNILVDKDWNVVCLIDLEWACSLPLHMQQTPYWLSGSAVDKIDVSDYDKLRREYMTILREEEALHRGQDRFHLSSIMEKCWEDGTFWFFLALQSPSGIFTLCYDHILPRFANIRELPSLWIAAAELWSRDAGNTREVKMKDKQRYDECLEACFREGSNI